MQTKQNPPKNHHYVPELYQKGFCQENGKTWRYFKKYNDFKEKYPSSILYEKDLHTVSIRRNTTVMIERFYSQIEDQFAKYLNFIQENVGKPELINELKDNENFLNVLKFIVAFQFWRTPCQTPAAKILSARLLHLYDNANPETQKLLKQDRRFIKTIQKKSRKAQPLKVAQHLLLPILAFDHSVTLGEIQFCYIKDENKTIFTSDRPVSYDTEALLFKFEEFLFPISKNLFVISTKRRAKRIDLKKLNRIIFDKALNYVLSPSKERLAQHVQLSTSTEEKLLIADCVIESELNS
ncbi:MULTISPECIES: DUF4238 domain-containing protein [Pseudomonas]|uniref:DUF4238 domain-containing protein n=1 Tax=Pseudomonas aphyarum TaxID=2942629 RepID=A0ABT5PJC7_9PSED|nr:DUF4238 domain-containing protein [Pseudomonas aphyarum]MDD0968303.1 DUF4238 domain-containing protein [Pseudomonas aphyarum]MDD1124002.1 DUF4238 domain-containing protein [Pseudomonas aphyarum]